MPALLCFWGSAEATLVYWDGGGDGLSWDDPVNWSTDAAPGITDDVILDNRFVTTDYTVYLPSGNITTEINSLVITPLAAQVITLVLPGSNTSSTGFIANSSGDAVILNKGAIFKNASGAVSGNTVSVAGTGFFRINNGGRYIHNTPRAHAGLVSRLSALPGTENGTFVFDVPGGAGYVLSLSDRTFGTLVLSGEAAGGNKAYTANGTKQLTINGNLVLQSGARYAHSISNHIEVKGDCILAAGSVLDISTGSNNTHLSIAGDITIEGEVTETGSATPEMVFNGTTSQHISLGEKGRLAGDGLILKMNNTAGLFLQSVLTVPYEMIFVNGYIWSTETDYLLFKDNSMASGAGMNSHVNGPVGKEGEEDFEFPVGDNGHYMPLTLMNPSGGGTEAVTDTFKVSYLRDNPQNVYGNTMDTPALDHISSVEYWNIRRIHGEAEKIIQLSVAPLSLVTDPAALDIARYDTGGTWINNGRTSVSGDFMNPFTGIIAGNPTTLFGPFTLASELPVPVNPLPVRFLRVHVAEKNDKPLLQWEINESPAEQIWFTAERSNDGTDFIDLKRVRSDDRKKYEYTDPYPAAGLSYYRVKAAERNGEVFYSAIVSLRKEDRPSFVLKLFPVIVTGEITLQIESPEKEQVILSVADMNGRWLLQQKTIVEKGDNTRVLDTRALPKGMYILTAAPVYEKPAMARFIVL